MVPTIGMVSMVGSIEEVRVYNIQGEAGIAFPFHCERLTLPSIYVRNMYIILSFNMYIILCFKYYCRLGDFSSYTTRINCSSSEILV
jgi:hypothetical protein